MARYDFATHRLFVPGHYAANAALPLSREAMNYLLNVLRMEAGARLLVFDGLHGEWEAILRQPSRKTAALELLHQSRVQTPRGRIGYAFAPLKAARLDYMVQKAVEMGVARLRPVITLRTQVSRLKIERLQANAIEACEQCGVIALPELAGEIRLASFLAQLAPQTLLVFADEEAEIADPLSALRQARAPAQIEVLVGPEGGFTAEERALILRHGNTCRLSLGPRILRADTAAVAALALVQATLGDLGAAARTGATTV